MHGFDLLTGILAPDHAVDGIPLDDVIRAELFRRNPGGEEHRHQEDEDSHHDVAGRGLVVMVMVMIMGGTVGMRMIMVIVSAAAMSVIMLVGVFRSDRRRLAMVVVLMPAAAVLMIVIMMMLMGVMLVSRVRVGMTATAAFRSMLMTTAFVVLMIGVFLGMAFLMVVAAGRFDLQGDEIEEGEHAHSETRGEGEKLEFRGHLLLDAAAGVEINEEHPQTRRAAMEP
ncbi:MAG: hypothetical protein R3F31_14270 [Verrucomicrobiales bacterium]